MDKKFILNFAPTGMIPTKKLTPEVPVRPEETVKQVIEAAEVGANMVHIHARDTESGKTTYEKEIYGDYSASINGVGK